MENTLAQIALCAERGKINPNFPFPPDMKGQKGAVELTRKTLAQGLARLWTN